MGEGQIKAHECKSWQKPWPKRFRTNGKRVRQVAPRNMASVSSSRNSHWLAEPRNAKRRFCSRRRSTETEPNPVRNGDRRHIYSPFPCGAGFPDTTALPPPLPQRSRSGGDPCRSWNWRSAVISRYFHGTSWRSGATGDYGSGRRRMAELSAWDNGSDCDFLTADGCLSSGPAAATADNVHDYHVSIVSTSRLTL